MWETKRPCSNTYQPLRTLWNSSYTKRRVKCVVLCPQNRLQCIMGVAMPLFHARGVFQYSFGLMPYRKPINTVGMTTTLSQRYPNIIPTLSQRYPSVYLMSSPPPDSVFSGEADRGRPDSQSQQWGHRASSWSLPAESDWTVRAAQTNLRPRRTPAPHLYMTFIWPSYDLYMTCLWPVNYLFMVYLFTFSRPSVVKQSYWFF